MNTSKRTGQLKKMIRKGKETGFLHIMAASSLSKMIAFLSGIILIRIINKADYGVYSYALNVLNYFLLFNGIGVASGLLQVCTEAGGDKDKADLRYRMGTTVGFAWDFLLIIAIVLMALFVPLPVEGSNALLLFMSMYPIFVLASDIQFVRLRSELRNVEYSAANTINSILVMVCSVGGALLAAEYGLIVGRYIAFFFTVCFVGRFFDIRIVCINTKKAFMLVKTEFRSLVDLLKLSAASCLTNAISQALLLMGALMLGVLTRDSELVASYQVATTIPFALAFISAAFVTYFYPYFVRNASNLRWLSRYSTLAIGGMFVFSAAIACFLISLSGWLVPMVFGRSYIDAISPFIILVVGFVAGSSFRAIAGSILLALRRIGFNLLSNIVSLLILVISALLLIPQMGMVGAALSYTVAMIGGGALNTLYLSFLLMRKRYVY